MKRIFIVSRRPLFAQGIEKLLVPAGLHVVGRAGGAGEALARIGELRPDVVVVGEDEVQAVLAPLVLGILREGLCRRVVAVDMEENALYIYSGARREVAGAADLIEALCGELCAL